MSLALSDLIPLVTFLILAIVLTMWLRRRRVTEISLLEEAFGDVPHVTHDLQQRRSAPPLRKSLQRKALR
jgi:hypothetical protein